MTQRPAKRRKPAPRRTNARRSHALRPQYTLLQEIAADPVNPMPEEWRRHQLLLMYEGLRALETAAEPTLSDWHVVTDAVNLLETLVAQGLVRDDAQLLPQAVQALAAAGQRHLKHGQPIRLDGPGMHAVRSVLENYAEVLPELTQRELIRCVRRTEQRVQAILRGTSQAHDVEVTCL